VYLKNVVKANTMNSPHQTDTESESEDMPEMKDWILAKSQLSELNRSGGLSADERSETDEDWRGTV